MAFGIGLEAGAVDDGEFGHEPFQLRRLRAAQQVADEQPVPGQFRHHAHVQPVVGIGAAEQILHEIVAALHVGQHVRVQAVEGLGGHGLVVVPPDRVLDLGGANHELVLGGPARMRAGRDQEGPSKAQPAFTPRHRLGHQRRFEKVIVNAAKAFDSLILKSAVRIYTAGHARTLLR